jgi:acetoin reductase-like protein
MSRVAVVTGAARGLGRGIAVALAESGCDVVVNYSASEEAAAETVLLVEKTGRRAVAVRGDVADTQTAPLLARRALEDFGALDVWVNNAGISVLAPVAETAVADLRRMLDVNTVGTFLGMQAAAAAMKQRGGRIVNVASELGVQAFPYLGAYSATKFAVVGLTQAAALELAADGITVNAVCPGTAETDMVLAERASEVGVTGRSPDEVRRSYLDGIPVGRFCTPEDVGACVAYLASPSAAYLTGQSVCINGGSVLH